MPLCRLLELYDGYKDLGQPWRVYRAVLRDVLRRAGVPKKLWDKRIEEAKTHGIKRLLVMLPRTWYKTTIVSIGYPLWRGIRDCNLRSLLAQNTHTNATAKGMAMSQQVQGNELLRTLYPEVLPTPQEVWSVSARCLKRTKAFAESTFEFAGTKTQVTSRHYNLIIEDDTVAPDKDDLGADAILPNSNDVAQAIGWHRLVLPLLVDMDEDQVVVVGTRWFELDLLRWVMDNEPGYWTYVRAVRETNGHTDARGGITYPERFSDETLAALEAAMGPYMYSCLYMNQPVRAGQMTFKPEWMKEFLTEPLGLATFTTVDLATPPEDCKGTPDYNVVLTTGKDMDTGYIYVLEYSREQCGPKRVIDLVFEHAARWSSIVVGIEDVAYQKTFLYWMRESMRSRGVFLNIQGLPARRGNNGYILGLQPVFASGTIFLRSHMDALKNELLVYPLGKNDDVAAALGMQLPLWRTTRARREEAAEQAQGVNDFDTVLALARLAGANEAHRHTREAVLDAARGWGRGANKGSVLKIRKQRLEGATRGWKSW